MSIDFYAATSSRIGEAVALFYTQRMSQGFLVFHADDLRQFVTAVVGPVAPGSADRVLRDMRQSGEVNYTVLDRKNSQYKLLPLDPKTAPAAAAFGTLAAAA